MNTYFTLLEQRLRHPNTSGKAIARRVRQETGFQGSLHTMYGWIYNGTIPRDVKLVLSNGYPVITQVLKAYPRLRQYLPVERQQQLVDAQR